MKYQKIINLLHSKLFKFRTKHWIQINDNSCKIQITLKVKVYVIIVMHKRTISVANVEAIGAAQITTKKVISENCAQFTDYKTKLNNTQIYNAKAIEVVMPRYNLVEYSDNSSKTSGSS